MPYERNKYFAYCRRKLFEKRLEIARKYLAALFRAKRLSEPPTEADARKQVFTGVFSCLNYWNRR